MDGKRLAVVLFIAGCLTASAREVDLWPLRPSTDADVAWLRQLVSNAVPSTVRMRNEVAHQLAGRPLEKCVVHSPNVSNIVSRLSTTAPTATNTAYVDIAYLNFDTDRRESISVVLTDSDVVYVHVYLQDKAEFVPNRIMFICHGMTRACDDLLAEFPCPSGVKGCSGRHCIKRWSETCEAVAARIGVSPDDLRRLNHDLLEYSDAWFWHVPAKSKAGESAPQKLVQ